MNEDIKTAIDAPRPHHQLIPMTTYAEIGTEKVMSMLILRIFRKYQCFAAPQKIVESLIAKGHKVEVVDVYFMSNYGGARVQGVSVADNGIITANNDRRKEGEVDGY